MPLADSFLTRFAAQANRVLRGFTPTAVERITAFDWPGNVRQLQNEVQRAVLLCEGSQVDAADLSIMLVRTQVVNAIFTRGLKLLPRARPYQETASPGQGSFPSGHASASFATATVLQRKWGWRVGVPAYAVAGFIGATRLENVHYLSDVTFGAALGIASGLAVKMPSSRVALTPAISPGRAGLFITVGPRS